MASILWESKLLYYLLDLIKKSKLFFLKAGFETKEFSVSENS